MGVVTSYLVSLLVSLLACEGEAAGRVRGVSVVLLGSTGDLATRYIWPALFDNYALLKSGPDKTCLRVFAASRQEVTDRQATLSRVLTNVLRSASNESDPCTSAFEEAVQFVTLSSEPDYRELAQVIRKRYEESSLFEVGRVVYLSIPPSAYVGVVKHIASYLRPEEGSGWLRVVIEKPFGHDLKSAKELSANVSTFLEESEVYMIDHYLGKFGVQLITGFREANHDKLSSIWNRDSVQYVEIAMKERLDVRGRSGFYDSCGVIRDVHQNHLTEMLALLLANVNGSPEHLPEGKLRVLSRVYSPRLYHAVLGQYSDYKEHLVEDGTDTSPEASHTPTFASVALFLRDATWRGVPFFLVSGKCLPERHAYVRVVFKDTINPDRGKYDCHPEIRFTVHGETVKTPGLLISDHFSSWRLRFGSGSSEWLETDHEEGGCTFTLLQSKEPVVTNSYVSLIAAVLEGRKEHFVNKEALLQSWRIWSPLLSEIELTHPHLVSYSPDASSRLDFWMNGTRAITREPFESVDNFLLPELSKFSVDSSPSGSQLFGHRLLVGNKYELSSVLAADVYRNAMLAVRKSGYFHIALPGGDSPSLIYSTLTLEYEHSFPWEQTHIWQTDERCVSPLNADSNLGKLSEHLISHIPIPYLNIHPLPIVLQHGQCEPIDGGVDMYERELTEHWVKKRLDYVLLGVGVDGHVASLFPSHALAHMPLGSGSVQTVQLETSYPVAVKRRMTLSLSTLLSARRVGLMVFGHEKQRIWDSMRSCVRSVAGVAGVNCTDIPVVNLMQLSREQRLTVYVDSQLV